MVAGEARARRNPREGEVTVFPLWPSCRTAAPGTAERDHFRHAEAQVARGSRGYEHKLKCVEYAVNPALEEAYNEKRQEMTRRLGSAGVNEQLLFHGTSLANSEAILRENFRLDRVGAEGRFSHLSPASKLVCIRPVARLRAHTSHHWVAGESVNPGASWCRLVPSDASLYTRKRQSLSSKHHHMCTRPELTAGGIWAVCVCTLPPGGEHNGRGILRQRLLLLANMWKESQLRRARRQSAYRQSTRGWGE
jgi:hypothetical protein